MTAEDGELSSVRRNGKSEAAFRTISEVAEDLDVPQHVLRFWEGKFPQVKPLKRGGGRRYYRPDDVALLRRIRDLLYSEGYTIKGVQKLLKEGGAAVPGEVTPAPALPMDSEPELVLQIRDPDHDQECLQRDEESMDRDRAAPAQPPAPTLPAENGGARFMPGIRRELEGLLAELKQLQGLLRPR